MHSYINVLVYSSHDFCNHIQPHFNNIFDLLQYAFKYSNNLVDSDDSLIM